MQLEQISSPPNKRSSLPLSKATSTTPLFSQSFRSITTPSATLPSSLPPAIIKTPTSFSITLAILRLEGVKGFYRGLSASLLGVTEGTIQWGLYEQFKILAKGTEREGEEVKGWKVSGAAAGAKMVATLITYPHEVRFLSLFSNCFFLVGGIRHADEN